LFEAPGETHIIVVKKGQELAFRFVYHSVPYSCETSIYRTTKNPHVGLSPSNILENGDRPVR
jgi:hypothetical protein